MDSSNPVVRLCIEGIRAEFAGRPQYAHALYLAAWEARKNDFDACIAAHYVARHQDSPGEMLRWNKEALDRANAVDDERVSEFYPSLYLNLGRNYEALGKPDEASHYYTLAAEQSSTLAGVYGDLVRRGTEEGLTRTKHA